MSRRWLCLSYFRIITALGAFRHHRSKLWSLSFNMPQQRSSFHSFKAGMHPHFVATNGFWCFIGCNSSYGIAIAAAPFFWTANSMLQIPIWPQGTSTPLPTAFTAWRYGLGQMCSSANCAAEDYSLQLSKVRAVKSCMCRNQVVASVGS